MYPPLQRKVIVNPCDQSKKGDIQSFFVVTSYRNREMFEMFFQKLDVQLEVLCNNK
jgi:choline kinase